MADVTEYPLGTVVTVFGEWDVDNVPTDPTTVTLTVQDPAGGETAYTFPAAPIVNTSAGRFEADVQPGASGMWHYRWEGTGLATGARDGSFYISPSFVGTDQYTYDPETPLGEVRLYIDDHDFRNVTALNPRKRSAIFTDAEIGVFLSRGGNPLGAAALALRAIAVNRGLLVQRRQIGKTDVDYGSLRSDLLKAADTFAEQAVQIIGGINAPADGFVEHTWTDFSLRDVHWNTVVRDS